MAIRLLSALNAYLVTENSPMERSFVMDFLSYYSANVLVDNSSELWAIEILGGSLRAKADSDLVVAVTGECSLTINGKKAPLWQALFVPEESRIEIKCNNDSVAYLTICGTLHSASIMKKPLEKDYEIKVATEVNVKNFLDELPARRIPSQVLSEFKDGTLRVLFNEEHGTQPLTFKVVGKNLRVGVVLEPLDDHLNLKLNGLSGAVSASPGSLVKLESGKVAISLNHRSLSGTALGRLHPCDLDKVARVKRGSQVEVVGVTHVRYAKIYRNYVDLLERIKGSVDKAVEALRRGAKFVRIKVGDMFYEAWVEEVS